MLSMNFSKRIHMHNTLRLSEEETEEREKVKDRVHQRTAGEAHLTEMMMTLMMIMMMMMTLMMQTKIRDVTYPG